MKQKYIINLKLLEDRNNFLSEYKLIPEETGIRRIFYCDLSEVEFNNIKNDKRIELIHQYHEFEYGIIPTPILDEGISIQTYNHSDDGRFRNLARITQSPDALGKNVDIIIVDTYMPSNAPELLDNNGNQRFIQYNWNDLYMDVALEESIDEIITVKANPIIPGRTIYTDPAPAPLVDQKFYKVKTTEWGLFSGYTLSDASLRVTGPTKYNYEWSKDIDGAQHGINVASVAAGNTNGWATESNIYFLRFPMSNDPDIPDSIGWMSYIRAFHRRKKFIAYRNNTTANPTIVNCSWGSTPIGTIEQVANISSVRYRGRNFPPQASCVPAPFTINPPTCVTHDKLTEWGFRTYNYTEQSVNYRVLLGVFENGNTLNPNLNKAKIDYLKSMISEGVAVVVASGNSSNTIDSIRLSTTDGDYNNTVTMTQPYITPSLSVSNLLTHRGSFPQVQDLSDPNKQAIIVGSCNQNDRVSVFSNSGKGVTVFAPGENIIVQTFSNAAETKSGLIFDLRNNQFFFENTNGTSFAAPQVVGVLACAFSYYHNNKFVEPVSQQSNFVSSGHIIARSLLTNPYPSPYTSSLPVNIVSNGGRCYMPEILCCQDTTWEESDATLQYSIWNDVHNDIDVYIGYPYGGGVSSLRGGPNRILFNPHIKFLDILPSPNP